MGAVFFFMLMAVLFFIALFFIFLSAILLIIRRVRKRRGKTVKKRWFVIPVVILVINIIVAMIPVGYIVFLRYANNSNAAKIVYAESGKALYWPMVEYESTTNWFEMGTTKYVQFREAPYINIEKDVTVVPKVYEELSQALDSGQGMKRVEIPQKYIELDEAAQPGTPIFGYDECELFAYSKDKMAYRHVYLVLLEGTVYVEQGSGNNYINGYPLPDEMNQYIIDTVLID
jgi:energy-coupling factor transporter transmembrane protein EcfT